MKVALYALLMFAIGAYCNCGCLNCNKQFHVISPPGAKVQIIHKKIHHCTCPTAIPYTVEIPVAPKAETHWARSYGYQIHPERLVVRKPHVYCPIPEEYDAQLQIPDEETPRRPTYLKNLYAHTDRVIICEPPRHHLPKVCSPPILEKLGGRSPYPRAERR
ncbi:hypothetical protein PPYR_03253 [Photinus pyralis]|uniref:Uncharacterized protein n=1 Tax=Photinus pyralis TaxID=7054 RepID=A0A5N4A2A0_PHOPY|nr:hypothetical protein PPYR_03253 [Photinus pyralis]